MTTTETAPPLPGTTLVELEVASVPALGEIIHAGLPTQAVIRLAQHLGLTLRQMLALIGLSESAYSRRRRTGRSLSADSSLRLYELARVIEVAERCFGEPPKAHLWLQRPRAIFNGRSPLEFAVLPLGSEWVLTVLARMEHGVYS